MEPRITEIKKEHARRLLEIVDAGLVEGVGKPELGEMCVMAAINYLFDMPHGDADYGCTAPVVRALDIAINDLPWSSPSARAKGMRREAVAKLGSIEIDDVKYMGLIALGVVNRILPPVLRAVGLDANATECEQAKDLTAAATASRAVAAASRAVAAASRADAASWAAVAASWAANTASRAAARDEIYTTLCDISTEALIACESQGAQWLDLCAVTGPEAIGG